MREQLFQRMLEASDRFAGELTDLVLARVDQLVAQANDAFEVALSTFASELQYSSTSASAEEDSPRPTKRSKGRPRPAIAQATAAGNVAEPHRVPTDHRGADADVDTFVSDGAARLHDVPDEGERSDRPERDRETPRSVSRAQQGQDLPPSTSSRRICGCAAKGRHRKDCSLPNISTSPAGVPDPETSHRSPAASPISKSSGREPGRSERDKASSGLSIAPATSPSSQRPNRYAEIEAAKARREIAQRDRAERARSFVRRDGVRPTTEPPADNSNTEPDSDGFLEPVASFEF